MKKRLKNQIKKYHLQIIIFLIVHSLKYFSFTKILSIGGVISGGVAGILVLLMAGLVLGFGKARSFFPTVPRPFRR